MLDADADADAELLDCRIAGFHWVLEIANKRNGYDVQFPEKKSIIERKGCFKFKDEQRLQ
jgi:hypothetical protein